MRRIRLAAATAIALACAPIGAPARSASDDWGSLELLDAKIAPGTARKTSFMPYRSFEGGVLIGLGTDLMNGLDLTARYYSGLTSLTSDETLNPTYRTFQFTVGYRFWRWSNKHVRKRL